MLVAAGWRRSDGSHQVEAVRPRDDATPPKLSLDHQPSINLVVGGNRNSLLIPVREPDNRVPRHCRHRTSVGWLTLSIRPLYRQLSDFSNIGLSDLTTFAR